MFLVNNKMLSILEKSVRGGLTRASANQAADIFAVTEDNAFKNAREVLFINLV